MKKKLNLCLSFSLTIAMLLSFASFNVSAMETNQAAKGTPKIDGTMEDMWKNSPELKVNKEPKLLGPNIDPDVPANRRNVSGTVRLLWDEKYLYVFAEIIDPDVVMGIKPEDTFNVFVSPTNNKTKYTGKPEGEHDANAPIAYKDSDLFIKFVRRGKTPTGPNGKWEPKGCYDKVKADIKQSKKTEKTKWVVEGQIPWAPGISVKDGTVIGFDCEINDQDTREGKQGVAVWNQPNNTVWHDPSQAGEITLKTKIENKPGPIPSDDNKPGPIPGDDNKPGPIPGGDVNSNNSVPSTTTGTDSQTISENETTSDTSLAVSETSTLSSKDKDKPAGVKKDDKAKGNLLWLWIVLGVVALLAIAAALYFFVFKKKKDALNSTNDDNDINNQ